jgi:DNA-binding GntR family transcriptional regulator
LERVYDELKRRVLSSIYRPGDRLEPATLADELGSSTTPVRDALHLLIGERLLGTRTGGGFFLPQIDEPALQDLYDWAAQILLLALRDPGVGSEPAGTVGAGAKDGDVATLTAALFERIGARSGNAEHLRELQSTNDRLHAARLAEQSVLEGWRDDLDEIETAFNAGDLPRLRRAILAYHRRRHRAAAAVVRALYRLDAAS